VIIGDLFYLQRKPWELLVANCTEPLLEDARKAFLPTMKAVVDEHLVEGLLQYITNPVLVRIEDSLWSKTAELLKPHQEGYPTTCNQYSSEKGERAR
jgi:hypothetical protein